MKINIYHAYDGFLYAPLFLAEDTGLLPGNFHLICPPNATDELVIREICKHDTEEEKNWFAICDPLAVDLDTNFAESGDRPVLVGSLIEKAAVWLIHRNRDVAPVTKERGIKSKSLLTHTKTIRCYVENTTGFLFGRRVQQMLQKSFLRNRLTQLELVKFGKEFDNLDEETLVTTSDILMLAKESLDRDRRPIVFSYPATPPNTFYGGYLFTGVMTMEHVLREHPDEVLHLLGALKKAIEWLSIDEPAEGHIESLRLRFSGRLKELGFVTPSQQTEHIRHAVQFAFKHCKLYSRTLYPNSTPLKNAERLWGKKIVSVESAPSRILIHLRASLAVRRSPAPWHEALWASPAPAKAALLLALVMVIASGVILWAIGHRCLFRDPTKPLHVGELEKWIYLSFSFCGCVTAIWIFISSWRTICERGTWPRELWLKELTREIWIAFSLTLGPALATLRGLFL